MLDQFKQQLSKRLGLTMPNNESFSISLDDNNNNANSAEKYALRPRSLRRKNLRADFETIPLESSKKKSAGNKVQPKSAPLSKYRRKTANARERTRMKEINQAFEALRKAVPQIAATNQQQNEKLTKITTLRLAMKYISALSSALTNSAELPQIDILSECSELEQFLLESSDDGESSLPLNSDLSSDHSLTPVELSMDFDDSLTSVDFSTDFTDHLPFDNYLTDFS